MDDRDTFLPSRAQWIRIEAGMSVDFWYIRQHPITGDLHPAKVELFWDDEHEDWEFAGDDGELLHMEPGTQFFTTEDEAHEALARGEWRREQEDETE
jgi:hypothetical protein